jgi:glucosamine kinase
MTPMRVYHAGFDGGGTRTRCVISDSEGSILGTGSGGPSNFHNAGVRKALASIRQAFEGAAAQSGTTKEEHRLEACFGLAALDSPEDFEIMTDAIDSLRLSPRRGRNLVVNDWRTAMTGAFNDEPGVTLIAGTGCVASCQTAGGRKTVRVGGWGNIVDDRGSAYDIGRDALYAAMRDHDGRGPKTILLRLIMEKLKVHEPQGIIERVYAERMEVDELASISTLVSLAAKDGDAVALKILREKGPILGELVVTAASRLGMLKAPFGVSLNGGVFRAGEPILGPLSKTIRASAPMARIVEPKLPPACGAVVLSLRRTGVDVDGRVVSRIARSLKRISQRDERRASS